MDHSVHGKRRAPVWAYGWLVALLALSACSARGGTGGGGGESDGGETQDTGSVTPTEDTGVAPTEDTGVAPTEDTGVAPHRGHGRRPDRRHRRHAPRRHRGGRPDGHGQPLRGVWAALLSGRPVRRGSQLHRGRVPRDGAHVPGAATALRRGLGVLRGRLVPRVAHQRDLLPRVHPELHEQLRLLRPDGLHGRSVYVSGAGSGVRRRRRLLRGQPLPRRGCAPPSAARWARPVAAPSPAARGSPARPGSASPPAPPRAPRAARAGPRAARGSPARRACAAVPPLAL
jgi:hypothetical protein